MEKKSLRDAQLHHIRTDSNVRIIQSALNDEEDVFEQVEDQNEDLADIIDDNESVEEEVDEADDDEEEEEENWISWFCGLSQNEYFCEIERTYIEDQFNLFGLKAVVHDYTTSLEIILDKNSAKETNNPKQFRAASTLYGLIHARYILTPHGLENMHKKFTRKEFGECPRALCRGQAVVPMGIVDEPKRNSVKLFCSNCQDVYHCQSQFKGVDGAFFGPTFPHLFFLTYKDENLDALKEIYVPRVFGYKLHRETPRVLETDLTINKLTPPSSEQTPSPTHTQLVQASETLQADEDEDEENKLLLYVMTSAKRF